MMSGNQEKRPLLSNENVSLPSTGDVQPAPNEEEKHLVDVLCDERSHARGRILMVRDNLEARIREISPLNNALLNVFLTECMQRINELLQSVNSVNLDLGQDQGRTTANLLDTIADESEDIQNQFNQALQEAYPNEIEDKDVLGNISIGTRVDLDDHFDSSLADSLKSIIAASLHYDPHSTSLPDRNVSPEENKRFHDHLTERYRHFNELQAAYHARLENAEAILNELNGLNVNILNLNAIDNFNTLLGNVHTAESAIVNAFNARAGIMEELLNNHLSSFNTLQYFHKMNNGALDQFENLYRVNIARLDEIINRLHAKQIIYSPAPFFGENTFFSNPTSDSDAHSPNIKKKDDDGHPTNKR